MCGVFFNYNKDKITKSNKKKIKSKILKYLVKRGPDGLNEISSDNWYALHSLLSITNNKQTQPIVKNNLVMLYNGEIYNDWKKYSLKYGDSDFLTKHINKYGINGLRSIDGEFALIIFDQKKNNLYIAKDPFGTKPLHYFINHNKEVVVTSYRKTIEDLGFKKNKIYSVPPNSLLKIEINNKFKITNYKLLRKFNFNSKKKTTYQDFALAFRNAIKKRTSNLNKKIFLGLSSGHDSGLIAAELNKLKKPFSAYPVFYGEKKEILKDRIKILRKNKRIKIKSLIITNKSKAIIKKHLKNYAPYINVDIDREKTFGKNGDFRNLSGFISTAYICSVAKKNNEKVMLTGQGADEIISDYYNMYSNSKKSCLKGDWSKATKPWRNFYGGWNAAFLAANESLGGSYGLEIRYPFLDYELVQSFLSLPNKLKAKIYKAPITKILKRYTFPYHDYKIGFYGYKR